MTDIKSDTNTSSWSHQASYRVQYLIKTCDFANINPVEDCFGDTSSIMSPIVPFEFNVTNDGYWGDTTATLDWCEGNYEVSRVQGLLGDRETCH